MEWKKTDFRWNAEKNCLFCSFEKPQAGVADIFGFQWKEKLTPDSHGDFQVKYENQCFFASFTEKESAEPSVWQPLGFRCLSDRQESVTFAETESEYLMLSRNLMDACALSDGGESSEQYSIDFLGSSIFFGAKSTPKGYGLPDMLAENRKGTRIRKETVSGTTLAMRDGRADSYAERMELLADSDETDALVIQLSTNDFSRGVPVGALSDRTPAALTEADGAGLDKTTVCGAIEYILAHASHRSPKLLRADGRRNILFVSCPILDSWAHREKYRAFAEEMMPQILAKWQLFYCDMFHSFSLYEKNTAVWAASGLTDAGQTAEFCDSIHPNVTGYAVDFVPKAAGALLEMLK